jgi:hypothetical protein
MPLTLTVTEGILPAGQEKTVFAKLCASMLKWHGLSDNRAMTENVVGSIHVLPKGSTYAGLRETPAAFIEWKVPSFAFTQREIQLGYFEEATKLIHDMSGGKLSRDHIYINVVHAVDGAWNWEGKALTNEELGAAVAKG